MSDSLLILTPMLVLVVVLFLGFVGCSFEHGVAPTLELRAQVVYPLKVVGDVTFRYLRPGQTMPDTGTVTLHVNNVFAFYFVEREVGSWMVNCEMTVELNSVQEHKISTTANFMIPDWGNWVFTFVASGTPLADFDLQPVGLEQLL